MTMDYPYEPAPQMRSNLEALRYSIFDYSGHSGGRFPERLEDLGSGARDQLRRLQSFTDGGGPEDTLIYLGSELGAKSDRSLALMITPPFYGEEGEERWLITIGGEEKKIGKEELDGWIRRSVEARKR